jgi:AraC-like DNA-binding protein
MALDLRAVEVADGPGIVLLLHAMRRLHARQRELIVVCEQASLRRALDRSGLARRFELLRDSNAVAELPMPTAAGHGAAGGLAGRRGLRASTAANRAALLADATLAIEERHGETGLRLHDIARDVATSDRQLQRVFAELAGSAFRDELAAVRMQHGAALLQTTDLPVGQIARRVGYTHSAPFAKAFRRHHGVSPTRLRRAASLRRRVSTSPGLGASAPGAAPGRRSAARRASVEHAGGGGR